MLHEVLAVCQHDDALLLLSRQVQLLLDDCEDLTHLEGVGHQEPIEARFISSCRNSNTKASPPPIDSLFRRTVTSEEVKVVNLLRVSHVSKFGLRVLVLSSLNDQGELVRVLCNGLG